MQKASVGKCSANRTGFLIVIRIENICYHKIDTKCDYISLVSLGNQSERKPFIGMLLNLFLSQKVLGIFLLQFKYFHSKKYLRTLNSIIIIFLHF